MKKYLGLFVVLVLAFVINTNSTYAREGDVGSDDGLSPTQKLERESLREGMKEKRETLREEFKTKREEAKQKMSELREKLKGEKDKAKAKIKELRIAGREKALERFDGAIKRITTLKDKINTHITKLEVKGVNVTDAKAFLATAQEKLDAADAKTAEINALLATSIDELSKENKTKLRTLAQETQALIKEAHGALKDAVKSLKGQVKIKVEGEKNINTNAVQ